MARPLVIALALALGCAGSSSAQGRCVAEDRTVPQSSAELVAYLDFVKRCLTNPRSDVEDLAERFELCTMSADAVWEECSTAPNINCGSLD